MFTLLRQSKGGAPLSISVISSSVAACRTIASKPLPLTTLSSSRFLRLSSGKLPELQVSDPAEDLKAPTQQTAGGGGGGGGSPGHDATVEKPQPSTKNDILAIIIVLVYKIL